jgi:hypothetical protein
MRRCAGFLAAALCAGFLTGCVEQRYVIESEPPGAMVYRNGVPIGATPCDDYFVYHGYYDFTLVKPGFETLHVHEKIGTPWYEFFPLDFVSETLLPFRIHDVRRFKYTMQPVQSPNSEELIQKGGGLRQKGKSLEVPEAPPDQPPVAPAGVPTIGPIISSP